MRKFLQENFIRPRKSDSEKPRIEFIDLAKGFCIILVVIFHSGVELNIPNFNALRMPLYFVLSGLFFRDYGDFIHLLKRKINKLLIPF
ncbi:MAG: acyltransferase family protein, partial [Muribaculaceae bacterium]|nr:acyltransferase family protein [Muribaculaceae bacterium]